MNRTMEQVTQPHFKSSISARFASDGLIYKFLLMFRRLSVGYRRDGSIVPRRMEVIETVSLGGRRSLILVRCGGQQFLVGCGPEQVNTIAAVAETEPLCF
ncbi:flagellar biosynthetic protein FliO [Granulicella sp. WH15]|uniref:FliO/MopB family protein n=1 Tax=Granulicella sp. WH15 TaxID=2602070 RepID=UPI0013671B84|nr:flagellar biosynthetic protein FliO [Granulicella sp. WH15]QHN03912.1 flagellar biosynthetic protein FliO [Granulicella sp. WH15]